MSHDVVAVLTAWSWEPGLLLWVGLGIWLYWRGWRRLRRARRGRPPAWRGWCFVLGIATLALALFSPISTYSSLLFSVHMVQHLLLMLATAPFLLLGAPFLPVLWGLPPDLRRRLARWLVPGHPLARLGHLVTIPLAAAGLHLGALFFWHIPLFYDAAQGPTLVHELEHWTFFGTALLYWWPLIHPGGGRRRLGYGAGILYLIPVILATNALGALIGLAEQPIYRTYLAVPRVAPLSVVQDQQLGGLIMWVPGGMLYLIPIFTLIVLLLGREEREAARRERQEEARQRRALDATTVELPARR